MASTLCSARRLLQRTFGYSDFRPLQTRVVEQVLARKDVLAVLPTGGGKSLCFQIPALMDPGLTLVVSPLIALMEDQVGALLRRDVAAGALNSAMDPARQLQLIADAATGRIRLLYLSPERLPRALDELQAMGGVVRSLAVDEAHCIVEWGHDFRPAYQQLRRSRVAMGRPPVIALTGSATPAVREEIARSLGFPRDYAMVLGSFDRPNLRFEVEPVFSQEDRLRKLLHQVRKTPGPIIVYAPTRGLVEGLARLIQESGRNAMPYHAGMEPQARRQVLEGFLDDTIPVVTATCAFGMGIDKPTVGLVIHWSMPSTPESYYQEAGRAGRDGRPARCLLFYHPTDSLFGRRQIEITFPAEKLLRRIWDNPQERHRQPASLLAAADRLAAELQPDRASIDWSRVRRRRREAERRLEAMVRYATASSCRRRVLLEWFGEKCGHCNGCDRCPVKK